MRSAVGPEMVMPQRKPRLTVSIHSIPTQLAWYLVVAVLSLLSDLAVFFLLLPTSLVFAVIIGFMVGTIANYLLSTLLAFARGRFGRGQEVLRLFAVALVGVLLTLGLVLLLTTLGLSAVAAKLVATVIVFGWNYMGRRLFVFRAEMPPAIWAVSRAALKAVVGKDAVDG
jgi:putative flippase GtrA